MADTASSAAYFHEQSCAGHNPLDQPATAALLSQRPIFDASAPVVNAGGSKNLAPPAWSRAA